jgi:hypothetical protein
MLARQWAKREAVKIASKVMGTPLSRRELDRLITTFPLRTLIRFLGH